MSIPERVARRLVRGTLRALDRALAPSVEAAAGVAAGVAALAAAAADLDAALTALEARRPFTAETTVHQAWARHPGVRGIFTRYHLPACDACAVGEDETLAEAATGYQIPLEALLEKLNALRR